MPTNYKARDRKVKAKKDFRKDNRKSVRGLSLHWFSLSQKNKKGRK